MTFEAMQIIKASITPSDFQAVLRYYGLRVEKGSILCPFHNDSHYGSCYINKDGKSAHCYACGTNFDGIDIVEHFEGLQFRDALEFLWTHILGRDVPEEKRNASKPSFPIRFKELEFLGIEHPTPVKVPVIIGERYYWTFKDKIKPPFYMKKDDVDEDGYCPVYVDKEFPSLQKMYETDPKMVLSLLYDKATETVSFWNQRLNQTKCLAEEFRKDPDISPELDKTCSDSITSAENNLSHAKLLQKSLWNKLKYSKDMQKAS